MLQLYVSSGSVFNFTVWFNLTTCLGWGNDLLWPKIPALVATQTHLEIKYIQNLWHLQMLKVGDFVSKLADMVQH